MPLTLALPKETVDFCEFRSAWSTKGVAGQSRLHHKTLSQKRKRRGRRKRKKKKKIRRGRGRKRK